MTNTKDFDWKYPHMCRDGHEEIGHSSDNELCPVCRAVSIYRQQLLKAVEEMKEELPTILWKDEHEPNLIKRAKNHALDQVLDLLKAKDYIQEFDNQIPREGL